MLEKSLATSFTPGDKVWVPLPLARVCGTVREDYGPLGRGGEHLYEVEVPNDPFEREEFILLESQMEHLSDQEERELTEPLPLEVIREFLINGGLLSILVRDSPERVWLRRRPRGTVTFTYIEGYSQTGGRPAPQFALFGEKISRKRRDEVIEFVQSFGVPKAIAEEIVSKVGTAP